jgi:hypothetical protein
MTDACSHGASISRMFDGPQNVEDLNEIATSASTRDHLAAGTIS